MPDWQSQLVQQVWPVWHFTPQLPPQSVAPSSPSWMPLPQWSTHNPPQEVQRRAADLLRAEWLALDSAHLPFFTHPTELATIIAQRSE